MMFLALLSARFITAGSFWLTWMATLCVAVGWDLVILDCSAFLTGACASAAGTRTSPSRAAKPTGQVWAGPGKNFVAGACAASDAKEKESAAALFGPAPGHTPAVAEGLRLVLPPP